MVHPVVQRHSRACTAGGVGLCALLLAGIAFSSASASARAAQGEDVLTVSACFVLYHRWDCIGHAHYYAL